MKCINLAKLSEIHLKNVDSLKNNVVPRLAEYGYGVREKIYF